MSNYPYYFWVEDKKNLKTKTTLGATPHMHYRASPEHFTRLNSFLSQVALCMHSIGSFPISKMFLRL